MTGRNSFTSTSGMKHIIHTGGLTFVVCLITVIIMPVYVHYLPPFMILWGLCWFLENGSGLTKTVFMKNKMTFLFFLFTVFFFWQISGLLLTDSLSTGFERIFKRLSFLVFPLVLFYPGTKIIKNIKFILRLFALSTFLYLLYCLGNALHNSVIIMSQKWLFNPHPLEYFYENYFYSARLSHLVHPSYLSMYIVISILVSLEALFDSSINGFKKGFWLSGIIVFLGVLYLLSSRAGILAAIITIPLYFHFKYHKKLSKWIILVFLLIITVLFVKIAKTNAKVQSSFEGIFNEKFNETLENDERLLIWKSAMGVIKQNIFLGVGTGDASAELKREFLKRGYVKGFYENLNAHNQFLEILLENGLIGLIFFLSILGYMGYIAISQQNILSGLFILMMIIFFMFETILNRLAGITFFPMFSFLLLHLRNTKTA
jgi:O-antigen ligase